jgi:hypothetical protein
VSKHAFRPQRLSVMGHPLLSARGIPVVAVDDSFDERAAASGLPLVAASGR